ncbi:MAG: hypothetical protein L0Y72_15695 [Gemmataceae bacterium]|nr:hypothetical protein [Gemmataceae bacterium]MCI0740490.1 hypothetical protein [Gemmataceae bacterium]
MANCIEKITAHNVSVTPMLAEVRVEVSGAVPADAVLRGRIVGPRCPGVSTIEIAYSLRAERLADQAAVVLVGKVPEPSLWHKDTPFYYDLIVECWQRGKLLQKEKVEHTFQAPLPTRRLSS